MKRWLIYGANGYTAQLLITQALARGHVPILAGRNIDAIFKLTSTHKLAGAAFSLEDPKKAALHLQHVDLVLNCAGPFSQTANKLLAACELARCHYLDITGEISVLEGLHDRDAALKGAGITAISGVGFDVVPTDCLAAMLKRNLPDATHLSLAFKPIGGGISPGTLKTVVESLSTGGWIRRDGTLVNVPFAHDSRLIPFADQASAAVTVPWGDVASAYHSTGIANIEVFLGGSRQQMRALRLLRHGRGLFRLPGLSKLAKRLIHTYVHGPSPEQRLTARMELWGKASNDKGQHVEMTMQTKEGYSLTAESAVKAVEHVLAGSVPSGALTPSLAFGADFVKELDGIVIKVR